MTEPRPGASLNVPEQRDENRADPSWLSTRRAADVRAREPARLLVRQLGHYLAPGPAHGIDVGTGTGANHQYLTAHLPVPTHWTVLDHDRDLLDHPAHGRATTLVGEIADLPELIPQATTGATFLTCSALLDVLREHDVEQLTDVALELGIPALFSLSVTGAVAIHPHDPLDDRITDAFNAHQRRDGRLGPDAPRFLASRLPGGRLRQVRTPWRLSADRARSDAELMRQYLRERAAVALDQDPDLGDAIRRWLPKRLADVDAGRLAITVDHVDQLIAPPR